METIEVSKPLSTLEGMSDILLAEIPIITHDTQATETVWFELQDDGSYEKA